MIEVPLAAIRASSPIAASRTRLRLDILQEPEAAADVLPGLASLPVEAARKERCMPLAHAFPGMRQRSLRLVAHEHRVLLQQPCNTSLQHTVITIPTDPRLHPPSNTLGGSGGSGQRPPRITDSP